MKKTCLNTDKMVEISTLWIQEEVGWRNPEPICAPVTGEVEAQLQKRNSDSGG